MKENIVETGIVGSKFFGSFPGSLMQPKLLQWCEPA